ncbi:hypothetical protein D4Q80_03265 [bacterium]|nr:MAG: hypothetical protein D4Q80_03265 [bacterium]
MHLILDLIYQWSQRNLDIVFFIYGLAFVAMGIAIWVQPKKESEFKLANILWLLAGFGLIHGTNEFLDMWAIIKGRSPVLNTVRSFILIISYLFLFEFGRQLFRICEQKNLEKITKLFGWWLTLIIGLGVFIFGFISTDFWKIGTIWARYLLGFPGGLLISFGFVLYYKYEEKKLQPLKIKKYFFLASLSFLVYGILGGLVVPRGDFFPSNWVNADSFLLVVYIPVQVFRAICAIIIAWAVCGMLRIFNWETVEKLQREITERKRAQELLQRAYADLEIRVQERTRELTKSNDLLKIEISERQLAQEELNKAYIKLRETQDQLIQAEKLNAVGLLASGVAHEVRNPLGIIIQGVNYLETRISSKEEDIFEVLAMLKDSVKRADKIINALLDFSRAASLNLQPEDINSILENSLSLVKNQFKFEHIEIVRELKTDIPKVLVDKNKIEQVCVNMLLNAAQAMLEGGKIIIRSYDKQLEEIKNGIGKRDEDHFRVGEKAVIVEFEDTGIGISEENIGKIFDPFFTTKGPRGGTGLGLSVSRNILHMHKGLIYAESQVGKGTKITIILKIAGR